MVACLFLRVHVSVRLPRAPTVCAVHAAGRTVAVTTAVDLFLGLSRRGGDRSRGSRRHCFLLRQGYLVVELSPAGGVLGTLGRAALAAMPPFAYFPAPAAKRARGASVASALHPRAVVTALAENELSLLLFLSVLSLPLVLRCFPDNLLFLLVLCSEQNRSKVRIQKGTHAWSRWRERII